MAWAFHGFDGTGRNVKRSVNMPGVLQEKEGVGAAWTELLSNVCPLWWWSWWDATFTRARASCRIIILNYPVRRQETGDDTLDSTFSSLQPLSLSLSLLCFFSCCGGHPGVAHLFAGMWKLIAVVHSCGIWPKFLSSSRRVALFRSSIPLASPISPAPPPSAVVVVVSALKSWKQCAFRLRLCCALNGLIFRFLLSFFFFGAPPVFFFFFFVLLRKFYIFSVGITEGLEYIYIWQLAALSGLRCYGGAAGSSRARRRRGWSKNLLLVLKFLILCYLAAQTICCQWEYPKRRERESDRDRGEREERRAVL